MDRPEVRAQTDFGPPETLRVCALLDDGISQRYGAEGEFLALVNIVLDRNAIYGNAIIVFSRYGLEREPWIERDNPGHRL